MASIMIASPDESERERMVRALEDDGHALVACPDGDAVRKVIQQQLPELVITDVDLPGLDAFEMVRVLETASDGMGVPLIVGHSGRQEQGMLQGGSSGFTWMGLTSGPEDLRLMVRARLLSGGLESQAKILVVDDDMTVRSVLERQLVREGHAVITALDGVEGLSRLEEKPDLILTDISMPNLNGLEMLSQLRAEPKYREIPVIIMTGHAREADDVAKGLGLGANDYVRKPFEWAELFARVQTQLRIREASKLMVEKQRDLAIIELAGAAAHEINNPLAVIVARMELVLDKMEPSNPLFKDMDRINILVGRITEIVKKMGRVRRYQVQHYCGGVNILDLDKASE